MIRFILRNNYLKTAKIPNATSKECLVLATFANKND